MRRQATVIHKLHFWHETSPESQATVYDAARFCRHIRRKAGLVHRTYNHFVTNAYAMKVTILSAVCALLLGLTSAESNLTTPQSTQQILEGDFKPPQVWENTNLVRTTNLEKGYVRETINVVVNNKDSKPQSEYYVPFGYDVIGRVGGFEVRDKKDADKDKFEVTTAALAAVLSADGSSSKYDILQASHDYC